MTAGRRLTVAVATTALTFGSALAALPAGATAASTATSTGQDARPSASELRVPATVTPPRATSRALRGRPLFAFWGTKYNRIDGFTFTTATRGSGTAVKVEAAWKTYRSGPKPIKPKVFLQARVDGGKWTKVKGVKGRIGKQYVTAEAPAYAVPAGVAAQTVDYRLKTKKPKKGPRRARRSVASKPVSIRFESQAAYTGEALRYYQAIATLCPTASVTIDTPEANITEDHDGLFSWQYGITIDAASLATQNNSVETNSAIAVHECAHQKQFYNWGGTRQSWNALVKRSAEVFVADNNPDPSIPTPPMAPDWAPLEHAADCATLAIYPGNRRTYGGYCNPSELAAAALLWQNQQY